MVSLHEFGHYIVARLCGVKVVRFSVGFGKPFFTRKRGDTEWCLAPIPLGGYVKMVDTREGEVSEADLPYAFDKQHPAKRIAIVAAGPLTNLALAVLLYGLSFSFGVTELRPYVGTVEPDTIAARTGFQSGDKYNPSTAFPSKTGAARKPKSSSTSKPAKSPSAFRRHRARKPSAPSMPQARRKPVKSQKTKATSD
ncbi:integral membrane protein [Neisseria gonorrhoeae]|uniref:Integral membrane protein n=1 Tax=Neisseria gonorrhoeae TaxID=485 RepID=A0A379B0M8_NEIGO|nr:integral membrane protein [Neisseria gonorrhoeae]